MTPVATTRHLTQEESARPSRERTTIHRSEPASKPHADAEIGCRPRAAETSKPDTQKGRVQGIQVMKERKEKSAMNLPST